MVLSRRSALIFVIAALMPIAAFAQNEQLRSAIRADIMADPRSSEMSPTEIDAMVEALATQAEEEGTAQQYLESEQNTFNEPAPAPVYEETFSLNTLALSIAVLLLVLSVVTAFLIWHRAHRSASATAE